MKKDPTAFQLLDGIIDRYCNLFYCSLLTPHKFWEVAEERYLSAEVDKLATHKSMADYFEGKWYNTGVPYYDKQTITRKTALRYVAPQPYVSSYNYAPNDLT